MYNHTMLLGRVFMISEVKQHLAMLVLGWVTAWGNPRQDQPFELIFKLLNSRNLLQNIFLFPNHLFFAKNRILRWKQTKIKNKFILSRVGIELTTFGWQARCLLPWAGIPCCFQTYFYPLYQTQKMRGSVNWETGK